MAQFYGHFGRLLNGAGLFLIVLGILLVLSPGIPFLGKLPGDMVIERENMTLYFPVVTSILLSVILTIILNLFR